MSSPLSMGTCPMRSVSSPSQRVQAVAAALVARPAFWVLFVALAATWPFIRPLAHHPPPRLPVLGTMHRFELVDERGSPFGTAELAGRAWVASFVFTRCNTACPAITAKMKQVQDRARQLGSAFHLVSFSVDPEHDTPPILAAYARRHGASPRLWSFLTGPPDAVRSAVSEGLKVSMGRDEGATADISHGTHLVLVDGLGQVRAYYDTDEPAVVDDVLRDVSLHVNRGD